MNRDELSAAIENAFRNGNHQNGLILLREFNDNPAFANPASANQQALAEEQIGDWALAGKAHHLCIQLAPHVASAYLYAAYWLEKSNKSTAAAALYSLAVEADSKIFLGEHEPSDARGMRALAGRACLRNFLSQHHVSQMAELKATPRITKSVWPQTDDTLAGKLSSSIDDYQPQLFYIPELREQPYHDAKEFGWSDALSDSYAAIREELSAAIAARTSLRPYLENAEQVPDNLSQLANSDLWSALDIYKDGVENKAVAELFPSTLAAISAIPTYSANDSAQPFEVFFSVLAPGQHIAPHYGQSNHSLTVHLPIDIPGDCYLEVAGEKCYWRHGKVVIFDDNFLHSAHNNSEQPRVVLIFSIWHPDLEEEEKTSIQAAFAARTQWMLSRREKINTLLE